MKPDLRKQPTERLSQWALWIIVALTAVVFALFFFVGYDNASDDGAPYNAPMLTTAVLVLQYVLLAVAIAVLLAAVVRSVRLRSKGDRVVNGVPVARIVLGVVAGTVVLLGLTFLLAGTDAMTVNGAAYTDKFWLRVAGMFVDTSLWLLVAAILAAGYGATRYRRKDRRGK